MTVNYCSCADLMRLGYPVTAIKEHDCDLYRQKKRIAQPSVVRRRKQRRQNLHVRREEGRYRKTSEVS